MSRGQVWKDWNIPCHSRQIFTILLKWWCTTMVQRQKKVWNIIEDMSGETKKPLLSVTNTPFTILVRFIRKPPNFQAIQDSSETTGITFFSLKWKFRIFLILFYIPNLFLWNCLSATHTQSDTNVPCTEIRSGFLATISTQKFSWFFLSLLCLNGLNNLNSREKQHASDLNEL